MQILSSEPLPAGWPVKLQNAIRNTDGAAPTNEAAPPAQTQHTLERTDSVASKSVPPPAPANDYGSSVIDTTPKPRLSTSGPATYMHPIMTKPEADGE